MENKNTQSTAMKFIVAFVVLMYVISPIAFLPGPVDDVIAILMSIAVNRRQIGGGD